MSKKTTIIILISAGVLVLGYFLFTALLALKTSNDILDRFDEINNSLIKTDSLIEKKDTLIKSFNADSFIQQFEKTKNP